MPEIGRDEALPAANRMQIDPTTPYFRAVKMLSTLT
jgi:hypothetical protein